MKVSKFNFSNIALITLLILSLIISCTPYEKLTYVKDVEENAQEVYKNQRQEKTIKPFDNLNVKVYSLDPKISAIFIEENARNMDIRFQSYTVSKEGYITLPFINKIDVKGLTIDEARLKIEEKMNDYLNDVSVLVRFIGNRVTVLGEVRSQGEFEFFDEKITIFQALSYAQGVADFGNRQQITLVREVDDVFTYHTIDLTQRDVVESEYYYLLPNDVIIVNPIKAKYRYLRDYALLGTFFTTISTAALVLNVIVNLK